MTMTNITAGFRVTGIYPLDRTAIPILAKECRRESLAQKTGLQFIPLYSPLGQKSKERSQVYSFNVE